jgi:hypothetical protein
MWRQTYVSVYGSSDHAAASMASSSVRQCSVQSLWILDLQPEELQLQVVEGHLAPIQRASQHQQILLVEPFERDWPFNQIRRQGGDAVQHGEAVARERRLPRCRRGRGRDAGDRSRRSKRLGNFPGDRHQGLFPPSGGKTIEWHSRRPYPLPVREVLHDSDAGSVTRAARTDGHGHDDQLPRVSSGQYRWQLGLADERRPLELGAHQEYGDTSLRHRAIDFAAPCCSNRNV